VKSYGQQCAVALALDLIGDRWTLLIIRELMTSGGSRFTDLQNGLPGIASNMLSNRLREMEQNGVLFREDAPPPIATTLFHLTERGEALAPVLAAVGAWGMPLLEPNKAGAVFRSRNLRLPLQLYLTAHSKSTKPIMLLIRTGDEPLTVKLTRDRTTVQTFASKEPDVTISGEPHAVLRFLLKKLSIAEARNSGLRVEGDLSALEQIVTRWLPA
jgi:DNA-binding HxlR family transcriptional regulator